MSGKNKSIPNIEFGIELLKVLIVELSAIVSNMHAENFESTFDRFLEEFFNFYFCNM